MVSVYILFQISSDGETNWIEGIQLLSLYLILGILFFYLPEPAHTRTLGFARFSRTTFDRKAQAFDEEAKTDVRSTGRESLRRYRRRVRRREARAQT